MKRPRERGLSGCKRKAELCSLQGKSCADLGRDCVTQHPAQGGDQALHRDRRAGTNSPLSPWDNLVTGVLPYPPTQRRSRPRREVNSHSGRCVLDAVTQDRGLKGGRGGAHSAADPWPISQVTHRWLRLDTSNLDASHLEVA